MVLIANVIIVQHFHVQNDNPQSPSPRELDSTVWCWYELISYFHPVLGDFEITRNLHVDTLCGHSEPHVMYHRSGREDEQRLLLSGLTTTSAICPHKPHERRWNNHATRPRFGLTGSRMVLKAIESQAKKSSSRMDSILVDTGVVQVATLRTLNVHRPPAHAAWSVLGQPTTGSVPDFLLQRLSHVLN